MKNNLDGVLSFMVVAISVVAVGAAAFTVAIADEKIRVIDGDSIAYGEQRLRLACIDAPEKGQAGFTFSKELLSSKINLRESLEVEVVGSDTYNRQVAIVSQRGKNLNLEMLRSGGAMVYSPTKSHCKDSQEFILAEQEAKELEVGIWSPPAYPPISPSTFRKLKPFLK